MADMVEDDYYPLTQSYSQRAVAECDGMTRRRGVRVLFVAGAATSKQPEEANGQRAEP